MSVAQPLRSETLAGRCCETSARPSAAVSGRYSGALSLVAQPASAAARQASSQPAARASARVARSEGAFWLVEFRWVTMERDLTCSKPAFGRVQPGFAYNPRRNEA